MKSQRQERILKLIETNEVETQEELLRLLNQDGFQVTQATVSRDIRELKLIKSNGASGRMVYRWPRAASAIGTKKFSAVVAEGFISADCAQNILVIKTLSGMAMAVAAAIDALSDSRILGTIAGDDTIMCVLVSDLEAQRMKEEFLSLFGV